MEHSIVRDVARDVTSLLDRLGGDPTAAPDNVADALRPLLGADEELWEQCLTKADSLDNSRMLYFDPQLMLVLSRFGPNFRLPAHNHDEWVVLQVLRGEMHFRWHRRLDDRSKPGRAQLEIADDRVVRAGEIGPIAPPPHDIHQLEILTEDTWLVTIVPAPEPEIREIYDPEKGTYEIGKLYVLQPGELSP